MGNLENIAQWSDNEGEMSILVLAYVSLFQNVRYIP